MNRLLFFMLALLLTHVQAEAQSFTVQKDSTICSPQISVTLPVFDNVRADTGKVTILWQVVASDFPQDWVSAYRICDNYGCYPGYQLWTPSAGTLGPNISNPYDTSYGNFDMLLLFSTAISEGCHYMTVQMTNKDKPADQKRETFLVCNGTAGIKNISQNADSMILYPNPAANLLSVTFNPYWKITKISICDAAGNTVANYPVPFSNGVQLDVSMLRRGYYYLALIAEDGSFGPTGVFVKQ
jgi:Secretion system C-terminal sorting domain